MRVFLKGWVNKGELQFDQESREQYAIKMHRLEGQRFEMTLERETKHRSKSQQGYFHGCIIETLRKTETFGGWTHREIKEFLEREYAPRIYEDGKPYRIIPEEAWSTKIQEQVNERIREDMLVQHNILIPLPNETAI